MAVTKTEFMKLAQCVRSVYLARQLPRVPPSEAVQLRMQDGNRIGEMARSLFAGGLFLGRETTREELDQWHAQGQTLFEVEFEAEGFRVRVDVLQPTADGWRLIEVKSSLVTDAASVPEDKIVDAVFQWMVLGRAGVVVAEVSIMGIAKEYVYPGDRIEPQDFLREVDVTQRALGFLGSVTTIAESGRDQLAAPEPPPARLLTACKSCEVAEHCREKLPVDSILYLPLIRNSKLQELENAGYASISELPRNKVTPAQVTAWTVFQNAEGYLSADLERLLHAIEFPAVFIDFETVNSAIPWVPGTRAHQPLPTQWSAHRLTGWDAPMQHSDFLHRDLSDPRPEFVATLRHALLGARTILTWSSYEHQQLKSLAADGILGADELLAQFKPLQLDLMEVVKKHTYLPGYRGKYSIKVVLPTLVPEFSYEGLAICNGEEAVVWTLKMMHPDTSIEERNTIALNLLAYCKLDTEAMVRIAKALRDRAIY